MNIKTLLFTSALIPTLITVVAGSLSITGQASPNSQSGLSTPDIEPLYGIRFGKNTLSIDVKSTGCTRAEDFTIRIQKKATSQLSIIRNKPDRCRAMPKIISLDLALEKKESGQKNERGVERYVLENSFTSR